MFHFIQIEYLSMSQKIQRNIDKLMENNNSKDKQAIGKNTIDAVKENSANSVSSGKHALFLGDTVIGAKILEFMDGIPYSIFITFVTIITLFADDIRIICFPPDSDVAFSILTIVCMSIYTIQMVFLCFLRQGYFLRYYFWLDFFSTVSMLLDLVWINALISGNGIQTASKVVKLAKVSRVSKLGANSTKLIRIIRLIRILRLYKTAKNQLNKENEKKVKEQNGNDNSPIAAVVQERNNTPRKTSKRMEKVRQASLITGNAGKSNRFVTGHIVKSNGSGTGDMQQKQGGSKHEVSLKNIVFQGSQRRMSALHPSHKLSGNKLGSQGKIEQHKLPATSIKKLSLMISNNKDNIQITKSQDNVMSQQNNNISLRQVQQQQQSDEIQLHSETKVGTRLKEQIQKNVVSMILLIMISIPLLNSDTWFDNTTSYETSPYELSFFIGRNSNQLDAVFPGFISEMQSKPWPLVYMSVPANVTCCQFPKDFPNYVNSTKSLDSIRPSNIAVYVASVYNSDNQITVAFDQTAQSVLQSQLSIGRTLFVCIVLIVVTLLFTRDVEIQALEPLENMIDTVKKISSNPLQAIKDIEKENMIKHAIENRGLDPNIDEEQLLMMAKEEKKNQTEPSLLENMIIKIGSLLAVGFGQAGTELIARNIENHGSLNVMMPGRKVMCIFGFCDIRNFTDATEVLEAKVMVFVNQIAGICHEVVNRVGGNPNKNIGDAFLLVWKFDEDDTVTVQNRHQTQLEMRSSLKVKQTADLAVYSFVKMIAQITKSSCLQKYKENQGLKKRIKNYEGVKMGFGLHIGWAIEGPIGSEFKIDASYLGSNVNFAGRLEAATKQYGVPMLISQSLYQLMTLKNKEHLRQVDMVKVVTGEQKKTGEKDQNSSNIGLYTVDLSVHALLKEIGVSPPTEQSMFEKKKAKVFHNQQRDKLMSVIEKKRITGAIWSEDKDIKAMRQPFTRFFYEEWKRGFQAYHKGKWQEAQDFFKKTLALGLNHQDGPSQALLNFMEQYNFQAPAGWEGARQFEG